MERKRALKREWAREITGCLSRESAITFSFFSNPAEEENKRKKFHFLYGFWGFDVLVRIWVESDGLLIVQCCVNFCFRLFVKEQKNETFFLFFHFFLSFGRFS